LEKEDEEHAKSNSKKNVEIIDMPLRELDSDTNVDLRTRFYTLNCVWVRMKLLPGDLRRRFKSNVVKDLLDWAVGLVEFRALDVITKSVWDGEPFSEMRFYLAYAVLVCDSGPK
jgi:hypothetical protein